MARFLSAAAIPRLRAAGGGRIVDVSSDAARTGGTIGAHYAASKAVMLALTARAARERAQFPIGRSGRPDEVAALVRFLCEAGPAYLTGERIAARRTTVTSDALDFDPI